MYFQKNLILVLLVLFSFSSGLCQITNWDKVKNDIYENPEGTLEPLLKKISKNNYLENDSNFAITHFLVGLNHYMLGNYKLSKKYYEIALHTNSLPTAYKAEALNNIGICYDYLDDFKSSLNFYLQALRLNEKHKNRPQICRNYINIGLIHAKLKNYEYAEDYLHKALEIATEIKDSLKIGLCYQNFGLIQHDLRNFNASIEFQTKALDIYRKSNYINGITQSYFNIGLCFEAMGQKQKAIENYIKADEYLETSPLVRANILMKKGAIYSELGQYEKAEEILDSAKSIFKTIGANTLLEQIYVNYTDLYSYWGKKDKYDSSFAKYIEAKEKNFKAKALEQTTEMQVLYDLESKDRELKEKSEKIQKNKREKVYLTLVAAVLLSLLSFSILVYYRLHKSYTILNKKNLEQMERESTLSKFKAQLNNKNDKLAEIFKQILLLVENKKHIENPDLSVSEIAKELGTNVLYVSQAINQHAGKTFSQFINEFRIEEARKLLLDKNIAETSITEIGVHCGFSSSNTFFRQFKEITGLTPSQFRSMNQN
jgi:tetratricopeptide (TPR) repeat protein